MPKLRPRDLDSLTDAQLLDLRFCDLPLKIEGTFLQSRIRLLMMSWKRGELPSSRTSGFLRNGLARMDFGDRDSVYLAHHRLARLEKRQMLEVEGWGHRQCMRILRQ